MLASTEQPGRTNIGLLFRSYWWSIRAIPRLRFSAARYGFRRLIGSEPRLGRSCVAGLFLPPRVPRNCYLASLDELERINMETRLGRHEQSAGCAVIC